MSNTIEHAAGAIVTQLMSAERAGSKLVLETAALNVSLLEASLTARMRAVDGQTAISDVAEAHRLAAQARFHLVRAHDRLSKDAIRLGIDPAMWGDEGDTPPTEPEPGDRRTSNVLERLDDNLSY